jgi:hypothetical protein
MGCGLPRLVVRKVRIIVFPTSKASRIDKVSNS